MKTRILALGGSIRTSPRKQTFLNKLVNESNSFEEFLLNARQLKGNEKTYPLSNSEVLAAAAMIGAKLKGAEVDYFPLLDLFSRKESKLENFDTETLKLEEDINYIDTLSVDPKKLLILLNILEKAHGVILATPVYFGDRSSVANKFLQLTSKDNLLEGKLFASLSVGAKRNGGQETANIFALYEALSQGALIVGNGPKTSQYGGTAIAGDKEAILEDKWGLETCFSTGKKVALSSSVVLKGAQAPEPKQKLTVRFLVTMDLPDHSYEKSVRALINKIESENKSVAQNWDYEVISLTDHDIYRCLACNICPIPEKLKEISPSKDTYACIIGNQSDFIDELREKMLSADALVLVGANPGNEESHQLAYRYQAFMERTRFIRRNDFEMTNMPMTGMLFSEVGGKTNPIHNLKVMTSFMRHNGIMCPPVEQINHKGETLIAADNGIKDFLKKAQSIAAGRAASKAQSIQYKAGGDGGYKDTRLDHTQKLRV